MIVHFSNGRKEIIETIVKAVRTKQNRIVLCYKSPQSGARGIVEFSGQEVLEFLKAVKSDAAIDDVELFTRFAGVRPHEQRQQ